MIKIGILIFLMTIFSIFLFSDLVQSETASVSVFIDGNIFLVEPENNTYNFAIGEDYNLSLNVSSDFLVDSWTYTLKDRNDQIINDSVVFTPNTTFLAVRWNNTLIVTANASSGATENATVEFYIEVPNSEPYFGTINDTLYICEGESTVGTFQANDIDLDELEISISPNNANSLFFVSSVNGIFTAPFDFKLFSVSNLIKSQVGQTYTRAISLVDEEGESTTKEINISAIEINNAPAIEAIPSQTIQLINGENIFNYQVNATDIETAELDYHVTFLSGEQFFDISETGLMSSEVNLTNNGSTYEIRVCVTDESIPEPHENISICGQDGSAISTCEDFELTVTDQNSPPQIDSFNPGSNFSVMGTAVSTFSLMVSDPEGTTPNTYWFVDNTLIESDLTSSSPYFTHSFGCGVSGIHEIKAVVSDGIENISLIWEITVQNVDCTFSSGGSSSGGNYVCESTWVCYDWSECQNLEFSKNTPLLSEEQYSILSNGCSKYLLDENICGFQTRSCLDLNQCKNIKTKPLTIQNCQYTQNPNCSDGIKNCHNGGCELLVDCGGPCPMCPTCSDGIKNQDEHGIDCGGPCRNTCPIISLSKDQKNQFAIVYIIVIIAVIISIIKVLSIKQLSKKIKFNSFKE